MTEKRLLSLIKASQVRMVSVSEDVVDITSSGLLGTPPDTEARYMKTGMATLTVSLESQSPGLGAVTMDVRLQAKTSKVSKLAKAVQESMMGG